MITRLLAATVAGGIAMFILGFIMYGLILDPTVLRPNMIEYAGLMKEPPMWVPLVLANFVNAFYLAFIFDRWAGIRTFVGGMKGGAIIMFLVALTNQLMFLAFMNIAKNMMPTVVDVIGSAILGALVGGVIGFVLGKMYKEPAAGD